MLLHGLGATSGLNWFRCFDALAERFRVIAMDQRGHGRGLSADPRFRLEDCADDVVAAIAVSDGANPWDEGLQDVIPVRTKATSFKLTAERSIVATIAGQVVTAGKFEVTLEYVEERAAAL